MERAWLLNLDAERELAEPRGYTTPRALASQMRAQYALVAALCEGEPVVPFDATVRPEHVAAGTLVVPWSPTPAVLSRIRRLGLRAPAAPSLSVLQRVNHRRFQHELARALPEQAAAFVAESAFVEPAGAGALESQAEEVAEERDARLMEGRGVHLERTYGFAGKGSRRMIRRADADDVRWIKEALASGGLLIEPFVEVVAELSLHGWLDDGGVLLGSPCQQVCDASRAPLEVRRLEEPWPPGVAEVGAVAALRRTAERVAAALAAEGYFGPFGIDALVWRSESAFAFNPLSDLNARFTMGWSVGMGALRGAALERAERGAV